MPALLFRSRFILTTIAAGLLPALGNGAAAQDAAPHAPAPQASAQNIAAAIAIATSEAVVARLSPAAMRPYEFLVKDAKEMKGFFTLYQKDDKVWIEIKPEQLEKPFFFSVNVTNGIGERRLYGSQMLGSHMAEFRRVGNHIQLVAKNTRFTAQPGTPQELTVKQAFSDSLLASVPVASTPNQQTKAILIDAGALLFTDIPGYATQLDAAYHQPYVIDANNSSFKKVRADESLAGFQVNAHFFVPKISAPTVAPIGNMALQPSLPTTTPDPRSFFVGFYYSFAPLPAEPMHARIADDRIGHAVTTRYDFTDDVTPKTAVHYVNRWRLEKANPEAELSEPKQPIVYWLDKNIPEKYRKSVAEGVLEWNKAFERIGFKNAIVVRQQTEKDEFDTLDARHASIRWFIGADAGFAIGPSQVDPRSGEILDADIGMSDVYARGARRMINENIGHPLSLNPTHCDFAHEAAHEMGFALGLLQARGEVELGTPQADALAQAYVKQVIMHEVGHTLGLRHNFRSSTAYSLSQIQDPEFTRKNGMAGSIMDYTPFNIAAKGEKQGEYAMSTLGPYDYWAVEYAYKPIDPAHEKQELERIAARSSEPQLAYGTDEDAGGAVADPEVNVFDLGSDPLAYFRKRLALSRELWTRLQAKKLKPGESYESLRDSFDYGFTQFASSVPVAVKYIGGVKFVRDHAGTPRPTFTPVTAQSQREALALINDGLFTVDSFRFSPELISRLGVDHFDPAHSRDVSVANRVLAVQVAALDQLMSDPVAARLLDAQEKVADDKQLLSLGELYDALQETIWSELKTGHDIPRMRRNLQREHLKRLAGALLRPGVLADVRSLQRENAIRLQGKIHAALKRPMSREARAHLAESLNTLDDALKAPLLRANV